MPNASKPAPRPSFFPFANRNDRPRLFLPAHGAEKTAPGSGPALCPALSLALSLALCLVLAAPAPAFADKGPLSSLALAQHGIDECNSDLFNRAVDVPAVVGKASDALLAALRKQAAEGNLGNGAFAMAVAMLGAADENTTALLKPLLISEVRGFVNTGINGGYFAGQPNGSVKPSAASLAGTLEKMPRGRRQIVPGKVLGEEDDSATVSASFIDPKAGTFPLLLTMQKENGLWRVKEISNAQALFEEAARRGD